MNFNYESSCLLAEKLGYRRFTPLQEEAFQNPAIYDKNENIMVVGPTSSGKTLVPMLLYAMNACAAEEENRPLPKLLFVVPYRALAAQKCREIHSMMKNLIKQELYIAQSTGEIRQFDDEISGAVPDISVVINEKAFLFSRSNPEFLSSYQYVVLDEIGLLANQERGIKLDFLLSWAQNANPKPRVVALATPFYEWSAYAESFHFNIIAAKERPELLECPLYFTKHVKNRSVNTSGWPEKCGGYPSYSLVRRNKSNPTRCEEGGCICPVETPCRQNPALLCAVTQKPCARQVRLVDPGVPYLFQAIADLCRWHLKKRHQVLVFWNNRENCRQLALHLFRALEDILPTPPPLEECKEKVLMACTEIANEESDLKRTECISEDELFGILEPEHYRALCAGVGFHSSAVPLELRSYVESRFLEKKELKIVCATETLAFGVNSAVDAVIIAEMHKNLGGENAKQFLDANTYFNYIGRCGRLQPDRPMEEIVGWVHPILRSTSPDDPNFDPEDRSSEYMLWQDIKEKSSRPKQLNSTIFQKDNSYLPFLLLCLIGESTKTKEELSEWLRQLPAPQGAQARDLDTALNYLLDHGLIRDARIRPDIPFPPAILELQPPRYCVVEDRKTLCGFTPRSDDFDLILDALKTAAAAPEALFESTLIYHLLKTNCMENAIRNFRVLQSSPGGEEITDEEDSLTGSKESFEAQFSEKNLPAFLQKLPVGEKVVPLLKHAEVWKPYVRRCLIITAAVLCWRESANPRQLYLWFHTSYPLIQGLTHELSYLLEIAAECGYAVKRRKSEMLEELLERRLRINQRIKALERSVYFGIQPELYHKMDEYFSEKEKTNESAASILRILRAPNPGTARQLRRIFSSYTVVMDALRCQMQGKGPENYREVKTALRELTVLARSQGERTLWRDFAFILRNEVDASHV